MPVIVALGQNAFLVKILPDLSERKPPRISTCGTKRREAPEMMNLVLKESAK